MGVGGAALVDKSDLAGGDLLTTAEALAAAVKAQGGVDLVLAGKQSVDDNSGAVYAGVATKLGWPLLTDVVKIVDIEDGRMVAERMVEGGQETVSVALPAVVSVGKEINDPRYPSFMGIRKANKAAIPATPAGSLGVSGARKTQWSNVRKPEERKSKVVIIDGASAQEKAAKLADALIADEGDLRRKHHVSPGLDRTNEERPAAPAHREVLGAGRKVADDLGTTLVAAVIGGETAQAAEAVRQFGADEVLTCTGPVLGDYRLSALRGGPAEGRGRSRRHRRARAGAPSAAAK